MRLDNLRYLAEFVFSSEWSYGRRRRLLALFAERFIASIPTR
jgi:hypothetical protein